MGPEEGLRAAGLRATGPRVAVLRALRALGGHRSADELVAALRRAGEGAPRSTVFHVLGDLARAGLVMVADAGPGRTLYEPGGRWHHHLVCRRCAAVVDVPCAEGRRPCLEPSLPGAVVDEAQVIFRGLCARCASRRRR